MSVTAYPWNLPGLLDPCPTIGGLMDLCEENYCYMTLLAPALKTISGHLLSRVEHGMDLYLQILEQTSYTTLIHLTYYFQHREGQCPDPDATLRVYHDAHQVEILDLQQCILPLNRGGTQRPTLEQKWKANLFAAKWLAYCVRQGHRFPSGSTLSREANRSAGETGLHADVC